MVDLFINVLVVIFLSLGDMEMAEVKEMVKTLDESGSQEGRDQRLSNITADAKGYAM